MTKEELKNRLSLIEENIKKVNQEIQQNLANINLLTGGKQECLYWLNNNVEHKDSSIQLTEQEEFEFTEIPLDVQEEDNKQTVF